MEESMVQGPERHGDMLDHTHGRRFNPSNINHEPCHNTDDVTRMAGASTQTTVGSQKQVELQFSGQNESTVLRISAVTECMVTLVRVRTREHRASHQEHVTQ
jgi:hypothetical protein